MLGQLVRLADLELDAEHRDSERQPIEIVVAGPVLAAFLAEHAIGERSLKRWAHRHGVPYHRVPSLNHPAALAAMRTNPVEALAVREVTSGAVS